MQKFDKVTGKVVPVPVRDVDTDMIIPAEFLKGVTREGYGKNLFKRLKENDPQFSFNQDRYQGAKILVADDNFGCGSSREHAVWALTDWGIRVIIAPSFADIFASNSGKNGLILVPASQAVVDRLLDDAKSGNCEAPVDLEKQTVSVVGGPEFSFEYDAFRKHCIINGLDDIEYIRSYNTEIENFRKAQDKNRFFSVLTPNN